jgi:hypothetical protein
VISGHVPAVTSTEDAADQPAPSPLAIALEEIKPYVATAGVVGLFGTPADILVPVVRRLRGDTGVALGPNLMSLANGLLAIGTVRHFRRHRERWQRLTRGFPQWTGLAGMLYLAFGPVAAGGWKRAVILRRRSPLWGAAISPTGLLQLVLVSVALGRARRGRVSGPPPNPRSGAAS